MKKKNVLIGLTVLLIAVISFILWNNSIVSTITLDINPCIEIGLNRRGKVKKIIPLNEDAQKIINDQMNNVKLEDAIDLISKKIIKNSFLKDDIIVVLLHTTGGINSNDISQTINNAFKFQNVNSSVITITSISASDKEFALENNISSVKAAYINVVSKSVSDVSKEELLKYSIRDLKSIKEYGFFCNKGYYLKGNKCFKEVGREKPIRGSICDEGYYLYKDICYEIDNVIVTDNKKCSNGYELENDSCVKKTKVEALPDKTSCNIGEVIKKSDLGLTAKGSNDDIYICADLSKVKKPVSKCLSEPHIIVKGKCYIGPLANSNSNKCPNDYLLYKEKCYQPDPEEFICDNNEIYDNSKVVPKYCLRSFTYNKAIIESYKCEEGYELIKDKCIKTEIEKVQYELGCNSGFFKINDKICLNENNYKEKMSGYKCKNSKYRLEGNSCVIYDEEDALFN